MLLLLLVAVESLFTRADRMMIELEKHSSVGKGVPIFGLNTEGLTAAAR